MSVEIPLEPFQPFVQAIASAIVDEVHEQIAAKGDTPWMRKEAAVTYTQLPRGTFEEWSASGRIPSHGGRTKLYHRDELDRALGYAPHPAKPGLRKVHDAA